MNELAKGTLARVILEQPCEAEQRTSFKCSQHLKALDLTYLQANSNVITDMGAEDVC